MIKAQRIVLDSKGADATRALWVDIRPFDSTRLLRLHKNRGEVYCLPEDSMYKLSTDTKPYNNCFDNWRGTTIRRLGLADLETAQEYLDYLNRIPF